jgi:large subunit ribosomal protein L18
MSVFRSNKDIYVQLVDDINGITLASATSKKIADNNGNKTEQATQVGKLIAETASEKGINTVVFDRSGYLYHGRVKALAEGAREGGLKF